MSATLEDEVRSSRNQEIAAFVMPRPDRGQAVTWYASGTRDGVGEVAFVLEVGRRNLVVARASGLAMESVRHIDDPKLKLSVEQRESGAWDFTERDKQLDSQREQLADLTARLTALEAFLNEPAKKKAV